MGFGEVSILIGASIDLSAKSFDVRLSLAWISPWPGSKPPAHTAWLWEQDLREANSPMSQRENLQQQSSKIRSESAPHTGRNLQAITYSRAQ